jgi:hypothetical protein
MLVAFEDPLAIASLYVAGDVLLFLACLFVLSWRPLAGAALAGAAGLGLLLPLGLLVGIAAEARLDPVALAQRATVVELRRVGRAWWEWAEEVRRAAASDSLEERGEEGVRETDAALLLADRAVGWPAIRGLPGDGPRLVDARSYPRLDPLEVARRLQTRGGVVIPPLVDGWGRPIEVRGWLDPREPGLPRFLLRSAGADGRFEDVYLAGPFPAGRTEQDIVWADGAFVREPDPALDELAPEPAGGGAPERQRSGVEGAR